MQKKIKYRTETKTVPLGNGTITIENRTPILTPKERTQRRREIELQLYSVFQKYAETKK